MSSTENAFRSYLRHNAVRVRRNVQLISLVSGRIELQTRRVDFDAHKHFTFRWNVAVVAALFVKVFEEEESNLVEIVTHFQVVFRILEAIAKEFGLIISWEFHTKRISPNQIRIDIDNRFSETAFASWPRPQPTKLPTQKPTNVLVLVHNVDLIPF